MEFFYFLVIFVFFVVFIISLSVYCFILYRGDEDIFVDVFNRSNLICESFSDNKSVFSLEIPYNNEGKQAGTIVDAFARVLLPKEQYAMAKVSTLLERKEARRDDNYIEAFIVDKNASGNFILTLNFLSSENIGMQKAIDEIVDMTVDVYYTVLGRKTTRIARKSFVLRIADFKSALVQGETK